MNTAKLLEGIKLISIHRKQGSRAPSSITVANGRNNWSGRHTLRIPQPTD
jgi:hypothetical protein